MYNGLQFTSASYITRIVESAFEILERAGVLVEHEGLGEMLAAHAPGAVRYENRRLHMDRALARERFMAGAGKQAAGRQPTVSACAEVYEGPYLDPYDGQFKPWSEERLLNYFKLGLRLPNIGKVSMLGCPIPGIPLQKAPLYEKLYALKYGVGGCCSIWDTALCPKILTLWQLYAEDQGKDVKDVFHGTVYMISPLKMGGIEAEQMLWFREKGLKVGLGTLASAGLTAPVTPAGAIALQIAERVFISLVNLVLYGVDEFSLGCSLSVADMRTAAFQYGRPEQVLMNCAMSDIADHYGIQFYSHGGLTDAKLPSFEAGLQKTATALSSIMKGRNGYLAAGLLSIDEVFSPVQMVLDNEAAGYLARICQGFDCDEEDIGVQAVLDCVKENLLFMMHEHTVEHMRESAWNPTVFSREMYGKYRENGGIDAERAREVALSVMEGPPLEISISESCEVAIRELL